MPGRNDPCPCGSGKKFKKCCIDKATTRPPIPALVPAMRHVAPLPADGGRLGYYTESAARAIVDESPLMANVEVTPWVRARLQDRLGRGPRGTRPAFSIRSVRAQSTAELLATCATAGGPADEVGFREAANPEHRHACDVAVDWPNVTGAPTLLLALVAAELWRRLLPDVPSFEMIDEKLDDGFSYFDRGEYHHALRLWTEVISDLGDALPADVTSLRGADSYFCGFELLTNWIGEIETDLHNAVLESPGLRSAVTTLYEAVAARFPDELRNMRLAIADTADAAGASAEAVRLYEQLVELDPYDIQAAMGLAWVLRGTDRRPGPDPDRALAILQGLRDHPRAADYDIEGRIESLRTRR